MNTRQIAGLIAFSPSYFVLKNENVKVKVKYSFVLDMGLVNPPSTIGLSPPTWKWVECPIIYVINSTDIQSIHKPIKLCIKPSQTKVILFNYLSTTQNALWFIR